MRLAAGEACENELPASCAGSSGGRGFTGQTEGKAETMNLKQAKELVRGRLSDKRYEHIPLAIEDFQGAHG